MTVRDGPFDTDQIMEAFISSLGHTTERWDVFIKRFRQLADYCAAHGLEGAALWNDLWAREWRRAIARQQQRLEQEQFEAELDERIARQHGGRMKQVDCDAMGKPPASRAGRATVNSGR